MPFIPFIIKCMNCGHNNLPKRNVEGGVRAVLDGSFRTCRKCKVEFSEIQVPNRPVVRDIRNEVRKIPPYVKIFEYCGRVPPTVGY